MKRYYFGSTIGNFISLPIQNILGELSIQYTHRNLEDQQINAWKRQIDILHEQCKGIDGHIYFEFAIPRMGKRVDNILIIDDSIFVLEFKVGATLFEKYAEEQVIDYALDLKNFHEGSHHEKLIPVLVATGADQIINGNLTEIMSIRMAAKTNSQNLKNTLAQFLTVPLHIIEPALWEKSIYKPTPTIVEAATALYKGHNVQEISRSDAGAINLTKTAKCINEIVEQSKQKNKKSICLVTGVPGAGKTLAGLNIANERMKADEDEHAVFLSGNGPLVKVLREALTRDEVKSSKQKGEILSKKKAAMKANTFIQNIHHFRDDNLISKKPPIEKVVVFDEAQRAWSINQVRSFMKRKRGIEDFSMSEPEFLIDVMDRHQDWCTIICLIGGGQEINTGEAGLEEWILALKEHYSSWQIHYSDVVISDPNYIQSDSMRSWLMQNGNQDTDLHLAVSVRSFRSENLSQFIHDLLDLKLSSAKNIFEDLKGKYPIVLSRNLAKAKEWITSKARGSERIGLISSSGARRLRPFGVDVKNEIDAPNWFLNKRDDVRSSYYLEDVATEFDIQGLEIDWALVAWGANFYLNDGNSWSFQNFRGTKWQNINKPEDKEFLKNAYRVLLTRARQGMVIFIPEGDQIDKTRPSKFYNGTYQYLKQIGIVEI